MAEGLRVLGSGFERLWVSQAIQSPQKLETEDAIIVRTTGFAAKQRVAKDLKQGYNNNKQVYRTSDPHPKPNR